MEVNPDGVWEDIAKHLPKRTARQVRERYRHYLCPELDLSPWTPEDECLLRAKFEEHDPLWSILKVFFPNRSTMNVKNHWTTMISRQTCNARDTAQPFHLNQLILIPQYQCKQFHTEPSFHLWLHLDC
jgi:hypothetical protein